MGGFLHLPVFPSPLGSLIRECLLVYLSKSAKSTAVNLREGHSIGICGITMMAILCQNCF